MQALFDAALAGLGLGYALVHAIAWAYGVALPC